MSAALRIRRDLLGRLVRTCEEALPGKSFGLIAGPEAGHGIDLHPLKKNLRRTSPVLCRLFESYGDFYRDPDRGFCFDPGELGDVEDEIRRRRHRVVAVYHSHRCRRAEPSRVDLDLHYSTDALLVIVSLARRDSPEVGAFRVLGDSFARVPVEIV